MRRKSMATKGLALGLSAIMLTSTLLTGCASDSKKETGSNDQAKAGTAESGKEGDTAAAPTDGEKIKLKMVTYLGNPERDALVKEIAEKVPEVELEIITPPAEQAHQKIRTMLQAGSGIDIVELDSVQVDYISNGFIEPLDNYIKDWKDWDTVSEFLKDQLKSFDGSVYSIPYGVYQRALFYRKDWLEEKNIKVPDTWDELYDAAAVLTDPEQNRYGYSFRGGGGTLGFFQMTAVSNINKDIVNIATPFITKEGKSIFEYQDTIDTAAFYKKLYDDGSHPDSISWSYAEMVEAFYSGVTGMLIQDPEVVATCEQYMEEGTWDVAPLPVGKDGQARFPAGFAGWGIAASSKNKEASWKVIEALSNVEGNTYFCKKNGSIPIHTTAQEDPFFSEGYYKAYIDMAKQPDKYVGYVDGGETRFATKEEMDQISLAGTPGDASVQSLLLGKTTPEECVKELGKYYEWVKDSEWVKEKIVAK